jgi:hypothetical protein
VFRQSAGTLDHSRGGADWPNIMARPAAFRLHWYLGSRHQSSQRSSLLTNAHHDEHRFTAGSPRETTATIVAGLASRSSVTRRMPGQTCEEAGATFGAWSDGGLSYFVVSCSDCAGRGGSSSRGKRGVATTCSSIRLSSPRQRSMRSVGVRHGEPHLDPRPSDRQL